MKHAYLILLLARLAVFGQVAYQPTVEEQEQVELVREVKEHRIDHASFLGRAFKTKILFYGQVVDHAGMPVEGALVTYSPSAGLGALDGRKAKYTLTSGKDGLFKIMTNGTDMYVSVEKEGYRRATVPGSKVVGEAVQAGERVGSQMKIQYFDMSGKPERNHHPEEKRPVQFTIRKVGKLEQLKHVTGCFWVKSNATPRSLSLEAKGSGIHCIEVVCRSEYDRPVNSVGTPRRYDWSFEIRVNKGGVQEIKDDGCEAPLDGYRPSLLIAAMSADDPRWV